MTEWFRGLKTAEYISQAGGLVAVYHWLYTDISSYDSSEFVNGIYDYILHIEERKCT